MATQRYRTIVVGVDGSDLSDSTATRAARIAVGSDAQLVIVCAWRDPATSPRSMYTDTAHDDGRGGTVLGRDTAKQVLTAALTIAAQKGAAVRSALLADGDAADALLRIAADNDADLIVLGVSPHPSITERLLGTVATDVCRRAECDVLLVRSRSDAAPETGVISVTPSTLVTESIALPKKRKQ